MTEIPLATAQDIAAIARSYNVLAYHAELRELAMFAFPKSDFGCISKPDLHVLLNKLLLEKFKGECTLKAKLVERFIGHDVTAAFEIKVNKSRADFLTINGDTRSFEIKSELDNLQKLPKQIGDYQRVFDYNYLVIDEKHYKNAHRQIPNHYGILVLHGGSLVEDRPATLNRWHSPQAQLRLFSKKEFNQTFRIPGVTPEEVLLNFTTEEINHWFKVMLKNRYAKRWEFLMHNRAQIQPIDYQFFFQHNIEPAIIYGSAN